MSPFDGILVKWIKHLLVWVYEAPSSEALQKFSMEPEMVKWMARNTSEIKIAMSLEESIQLLKEATQVHLKNLNMAQMTQNGGENTIWLSLWYRFLQSGNSF